jgi:hypothetical protein
MWTRVKMMCCGCVGVTIALALLTSVNDCMSSLVWNSICEAGERELLTALHFNKMLAQLQ